MISETHTSLHLSTPQAVFNTPIGHLAIYCDEKQLHAVELTQQPLLSPQTPNAKEIVQQITHYFNHPKTTFTFSLSSQGTPFQQKVWKALQQIPAGKTKTYGELAKLLHTAPRAIGNACRTNPLLIVVPCHRIVGKNSLGGYSGETKGAALAIKQWLLQHESL